MFRVGNGVKEVAVVAVPSVFDFLFTPDGTRMLTLDARTGTLVLWDTDGQEVARLAAPHAATSVLADQPAGGDAGGDPCGVGEDPVETPSAHFMASFDGSTLSVTASKGFITAYRSTGKALFSLDLEANDSCGAAGGHVLNADGSRIVASYGPGVRVIETDISKLVEQAKKLVTRPFTKAELAEYSELWTKHLEPEDK